MLGAFKTSWVTKMRGGMMENPEKLSEEEQEEYLLATQPNRSRKQRSRSAVLAIALVLFAILSILNLVAIVKIARKSDIHRQDVDTSRHQSSNYKASLDLPVDETTDLECGTDVHTAVDNGCPFDIMSNLWMHPRCYNSTFAQEGSQGVQVGTEHGGIGAPEFGLGQWEWFEDEELTRPILTSDALQQFLARRSREGLTTDAFTHMSFHAAHCSYLARVATEGLSRVQNGETDVWIPVVAADPTHARHCEHVFGEMFRLKSDGEAPRAWTQVGFGVAPCVQVG